MVSLEDRMISFMEKNGSISAEDEAIYRYALKSTWILGGNIVLSAVIGFAMGAPWYCLLLLLAIIPLRSDAGGYHASNIWCCYVLSCLGLMLVLMWVKAEIPYHTAVTVCLSAVSSVFIFRYAPLPAENKPLDDCQKERIGKRARKITALELAAGLSCFLIDTKAAYTILSAMIWCAVGYIGWFIKKNVHKGV